MWRYWASKWRRWRLYWPISRQNMFLFRKQRSMWWSTMFCRTYRRVWRYHGLWCDAKTFLYYSEYFSNLSKLLYLGDVTRWLLPSGRALWFRKLGVPIVLNKKNSGNAHKVFIDFWQNFSYDFLGQTWIFSNKQEI